MNNQIKAALALSGGLMLLAIYWVFVITGNPARDLLISGTILSTIIGMITGYAPFWAHYRHANRRSALLTPILVCGTSASAVTALYHLKLNSLYREGVFHLTLAVGLIAGGLLIISYIYASGKLLTKNADSTSALQEARTQMLKQGSDANIPEMPARQSKDKDQFIAAHE